MTYFLFELLWKSIAFLLLLLHQPIKCKSLFIKLGAEITSFSINASNNYMGAPGILTIENIVYQGDFIESKDFLESFTFSTDCNRTESLQGLTPTDPVLYITKYRIMFEL